MQRAKLTAELEGRLHKTREGGVRFVASEFEVHYPPNAMSKLLKRLGFVYKKPKRVPAKADAAAQQHFVEQTLAPLMAAAGLNSRCISAMRRTRPISVIRRAGG